MACACGSSSSREIAPLSAEEQAARHYRSAGDELLAFAPAGAEAVIELDMQRLRDNAAVGGLLAATRGAALAPGLGFDPVHDADVIVLCAYDLGSASADTLTLVKSAKLSAMAGAKRLAPGIVAVASPELRKKALATKGGALPSLAADREFLSTRDRAVPDGAPGASLRLTARLDFDARVSMARVFDLDRVPTAISVWGDVVDDLAVVALLAAEGPKEAQALGKAAKASLARVAAHPWVRRLVLGYLFESVSVKIGKNGTQLVLWIDPQRLSLLSKRLTRYARAAAEDASQPSPTGTVPTEPAEPPPPETSPES